MSLSPAYTAQDAETLGIGEGDRIEIRFEKATVELAAKLFDRMAPGVVVIPRLRRLPWQSSESMFAAGYSKGHDELEAWIIGFIALILKLGAVLLFLLLMAAYLVLVERKLLGRIQVRYGPNRAGRYGLLQPFADTIKMMTKEDTVPDAADRVIFLLAPAVVAITALLMFAVIPFGPDITVYGHRVPLVVTDLNVGLLFVFALSSWGCTARPWGDGPPIPSTACWAGSAAQPRWSAMNFARAVPHTDRDGSGLLQPGGDRQRPGRAALYPDRAAGLRDLLHQRHGRDQAYSARRNRS